MLIDPLIPTEGREKLLGWLDDRVAGRPVSVLTTIHWHGAGPRALAKRYAANTTRVLERVAPRRRAQADPRAGETIYWLPSVGRPGPRRPPARGLRRGRPRLCPESWLSRVQVDRAGWPGDAASARAADRDVSWSPTASR